MKQATLRDQSRSTGVPLVDRDLGLRTEALEADKLVVDQRLERTSVNDANAPFMVVQNLCPCGKAA
jgi:hypothetical protein